MIDIQDRLENNYSVYCHVTPDGMYYFGQTNNIKRRWEANGIHYKETSLYPYIEKFGWDNIKHIVLFENQSKENALFIENFLIETAREDGVCINKQRSGLVSKEEGYDQQKSKHYYDKNKDKILEKQKHYYDKNKEQILKHHREYKEQNKEQIREQQKHYREQNKDKIKQYYEENKDKFKEYYEENKQQKREYYQKNRDKILEQSRQRYQRKKEEKQLKELGYIPLF